MTQEETRLILNILKTNYFGLFNKMSVQEKQAYFALWCESFKDEDKDLVANAIKAIINTDPSPYPPNIAQVKNKMYELSHIQDDMKPLEAWDIVRKAISRSGWYYEEEYAKLPPNLQQIVGSASQLHQWSQMDSQTVNSVISSNFQRSYKQRQEQNKQIDMLPNSVKKNMQIGVNTSLFVKRIANNEDLDEER